ncbi:MAG: prepilin-type N-terminal cleavage/methylation domain-containing protein [Nitrospinae bacterium]|nr:prepilin-type N-terminal cleavage/methylation domain-containing protein [Nitrospinota bacterium]
MRMEQHGFTLIELVTVIVIVGIMGGLTFAFLSSAANTCRLAASQQALHGEAWVAVERMVREMRSAVPPPAIPPAPPRLTPVTLPIPGGSGGTLAFDDIQKSDPVKCAKCVDKSTTITYSLAGNQLMRTGDISGAHPIASGVTAFTARHDIDGVISVQLTLADGSGAFTLSGTAIPFMKINPNYTPRGAVQ